MRCKRNFKYYTNYLVKNLINGKVYIGYHMTNNKDDRYLCSSGNDHFWNSIRLYELGGESIGVQDIKKYYAIYGFKNFERVIIQYHPDKESMLEGEKSWIAYYRELLGSENAYNIADGGN